MRWRGCRRQTGAGEAGGYERGWKVLGLITARSLIRIAYSGAISQEAWLCKLLLCISMLFGRGLLSLMTPDRSY